jgi:hypothetical protein
MAQGHSNVVGICKKLFLSPKTVETHVRHILGKLGMGEAPHYHRRVLAVLAYLVAGDGERRAPSAVRRTTPSRSAPHSGGPPTVRIAQ